MTQTILTPFDFSEPIRAGRRRFWKQLLPVTDIDYNGQKVSFDKPFHADLELSFKEGAYDQVPLVFADHQNQHNEDPRNFAGELVAVENRGDKGTWGLIEADREGAKAIQRNPKLGVSARIMQGIKKADGRVFNRAIRHVLLTMNPRVSGMDPWQAVDLSEGTESDEVVDLTAEAYTEGNAMGTKTKATRRQVDLSALDDEQFATLIDLATEAGVLDDEEVDEEVDGEDEVENTTTTPPKKKKSKTKITVEKESENGDPDDDEEEDDEEEDDDTARTDLSDSAANSETRSTVRTMQIDLAEQRWQSERSDLIRDGVPPFFLDLAGPILSSPDTMVIDLAEGETVNATDTVRKMLTGLKGIIDLSGEIGHMIDLSEAKNTEDEDGKFLAAWDEQYG